MSVEILLSRSTLSTFRNGPAAQGEIGNESTALVSSGRTQDLRAMAQREDHSDA